MLINVAAAEADRVTFKVVEIGNVKPVIGEAVVILLETIEGAIEVVALAEIGAFVVGFNHSGLLLNQLSGRIGALDEDLVVPSVNEVGVTGRCVVVVTVVPLLVLTLVLRFSSGRILTVVGMESFATEIGLDGNNLPSAL